MGMTGELKRDARRQAMRDIRLMRQQDHRRIVRYLVERGAEIVDANSFDRSKAPRRSISQLIAKAGEPERAAAFAQALDVIFVDRNAGGLQRAAGRGRAL